MYLGADYHLEHWEKERWSIDDFSNYRVVIAPLLYVMTDEIAKNIKNYVSNGGISISSFRCAIKDIIFPEEVEVNTREKDGKKFIFVTNFSDKSQKITINSPIVDLIREDTLEGEIDLEPFRVSILEK
jgi:beta-galactosidase GanA